MGSRSPNFFNISIFLFLMHLIDFYGFGSIEPSSKKNRNIEKIRFGSIELVRFRVRIRLNSIQLDLVRFDIPGKFFSFTVDI